MLFDLQHLGSSSNVYAVSALNLPVPGAVHGLECKDVFFHREGEHVFAVVLPVARCLPQFAVIDVGRGYFLKASSPVLILEKTTKPQKQAKSASWPAQVLYWAESWLLAWIWNHCNGNHIVWPLFIHLFSLSKTFHVQLSCEAASSGRLVFLDRFQLWIWNREELKKHNVGSVSFPWKRWKTWMLMTTDCIPHCSHQKLASSIYIITSPRCFSDMFLLRFFF